MLAIVITSNRAEVCQRLQLLLVHSSDEDHVRLDSQINSNWKFGQRQLVVANRM